MWSELQSTTRRWFFDDIGKMRRPPLWAAGILLVAMFVGLQLAVLGYSPSQTEGEEMVFRVPVHDAVFDGEVKAVDVNLPEGETL